MNKDYTDNLLWWRPRRYTKPNCIKETKKLKSTQRVQTPPPDRQNYFCRIVKFGEDMSNHGGAVYTSGRFSVPRFWSWTLTLTTESRQRNVDRPADPPYPSPSVRAECCGSTDISSPPIWPHHGRAHQPTLVTSARKDCVQGRSADFTVGLFIIAANGWISTIQCLKKTNTNQDYRSTIKT